MITRLKKLAKANIDCGVQGARRREYSAELPTPFSMNKQFMVRRFKILFVEGGIIIT
jgi:hypothetical protein